MQQCNAACNQISKRACALGVFRKYDLHAEVYHNVRAETRLAAGHVIGAIAKVAHAYEKDRRPRRQFKPLGAIEFNKDTLSWRTEEQSVSLNTVSGRIKTAYACSAAQKNLLAGKKGQADLLFVDGCFYLSVAVTVDEAEPYSPDGVLGVDLGIVNVATDSEGNVYTGETVKKVREKYRRFRQVVQAVRTRSARKKLAKNRRRESRFVKDVNHCLAKSLVNLALLRKKALAVELLTGIRQRGNRLHREVHNWAFAQLKSFLAYKARRAGVPLIEIEAAYSSQQCSRCAHTERANRPTQEVFRCRYCCFQANADANAAKVLEARATLSTGPRFYLAATR